VGNAAINPLTAVPPAVQLDSAFDLGAVNPSPLPLFFTISSISTQLLKLALALAPHWNYATPPLNYCNYSIKY